MPFPFVAARTRFLRRLLQPKCVIMSGTLWRSPPILARVRNSAITPCDLRKGNGFLFWNVYFQSSADEGGELKGTGKQAGGGEPQVSDAGTPQRCNRFSAARRLPTWAARCCRDVLAREVHHPRRYCQGWERRRRCQSCFRLSPAR